MSAKIAVLGTGLNGLIGSRLVKDFGQSYDFENLDLRDPQRAVDITDAEGVLAAVKQSTADCLIHLAAFTDVSAAWQQRDNKNGPAYLVNVVGTRNIVRACEASNKHLIHVSTAYVFDGQKPGFYTEEDPRSPIEWYGQSKAEAEAIVEASSAPWTILRIDQPFRSDGFAKTDILHRIINGIEQKNLYPQFTDHFFGPTYINDFVKIIDFFIRSKTSGLFHASSGEKWSDYDFATATKEALQSDFPIQAGSVIDYLKTQQRPYQINTALDNQKLRSVLDFELTPIKTAITETVGEFLQS